MPSSDDTAAPSGRLWRTRPTLSREIHVEGSCFEWIEQTDDPKFDEIRKRIESLWLRIPESNRAGFTSRLRAKRHTDFFSAYVELWYPRALEAGGLSCSLAANTQKGSLPDLLIADVAGPIAVGECYLRTRAEKEIRDDFVQRRWFDATLRKLKDKRIRLWIHGMQAGNGLPDATRFARRLDELAGTMPLEDDMGSVHRHGRSEYDDGESGWSLEFTLMIRVALEPSSIAQLPYLQVMSGFTGCKGANLFEAAISRKAKQHEGASLPVVICLAWNYFEHEPDFDDVVEVTAERSGSLSRRGVSGVFWSREVYPWNPAPASPRLLHWGSPTAEPLLRSWTGKVVDVRTSVKA